MLPDTSPAPSAPPRPALLALLRERMVGYVASRHGRDSAEDLAQEVFVVLEEKYAHLDRLEDLMPLCFQILRFKLAGLQRRQWRRGEGEQVAVEDLPLAGDDPSPEDQAIRSQRLALLAGGLAAMEAKCKELFRMKLQGLPFPEIQSRLGAATLNTVYTWDHRCRKKLLDHFGGRWP